MTDNFYQVSFRSNDMLVQGRYQRADARVEDDDTMVASLHNDTTIAHSNNSVQSSTAFVNAYEGLSIQTDASGEDDPSQNVSHNLQELKNWGLTDDEIEKYFNYYETKLENGIVLSGYSIKSGIIIDGKEIKSFSDLKEALALVDNTVMSEPEVRLKRYGFSDEEIEKYFNKYEAKDYRGKTVFVYGLKRGIKINGQGINSFSELIQALNKKDSYLYYKS